MYKTSEQVVALTFTMDFVIRRYMTSSLSTFASAHVSALCRIDVTMQECSTFALTWTGALELLRRNA